MTKYYKIIRNGLIDENPVFVQLLALCPLLAVTTSAVNALGMGLATTSVMIGACAVISIFRKLFSSDTRIVAFVVIVATFVTVLQFMLEAYVPALNESLGIFIALIVVNCILFARIELFASKNKVFPSVVDAFSMGIGYTMGLLTLGIVRELLGAGSIFGIELNTNTNSHMLAMIMAPGAFFTLGTLIMVRKHILSSKKKGRS